MHRHNLWKLNGDLLFVGLGVWKGKCQFAALDGESALSMAVVIVPYVEVEIHFSA
jgi:hypothetical protein